MSKKSRNIRARKLESDSEDESTAGQIQPNSSSAATVSTSGGSKQNSGAIKSDCGKRQPSLKLPLSSSMLSFEIDEGEDFQIKKSNHSKRIVKQLKKAKGGGKEIKSKSSATSQEDTSRELLNKSDDARDGNESNEDDYNEKKSLEPSVHDVLKSGAIPDANMIHLARKRRQMARECGEDFIPLDDTQRYDKTSSRLIRDDDNDVSDSGDETNVLVLTNKQKEANRRMIEERILAAEEDSYSDSEQEKEWEEQQIRKGTSIPAQVVYNNSSGTDQYMTGYQQHQQYMLNTNGGISLMNYTIPNNMSALAIAEMNARKDIALSKQKKSLKERLEELVEQHKLRSDECDNITARNKEVISSIEYVGSEIIDLAEDYKFFQELRGFVRDYVDCMNEKMSSVNYLERCMMDLLKQRADKLVARRQEDVRDQSLEFFPGKSSATSEANPEDAAKMRRKAEREGRRARRKRARENKGAKTHCDGMSTDDELINSEVVKFNAEKERLTKDCKTALDDVDDEFCSIQDILARFEKWKKEKNDSYIGAYVGLCLTKLFTPLIKLQLITWNPLEMYCPNFEKSRWFQDLLFYGSLNGQSKEDPGDAQQETESVEDADIRLLPNIIDKILVPKITAIVESIWDPLSLQQSNSLKKVVQQLAMDYPLFVCETKNTQALIKAIDQRIFKCLKDDIFMPLYAKNVLENRNSGASVFFYRQLYTCIKLLTNITLWHGVLSDHKLQSLALDQLLNRYVMIALQNAPFNPEVLTVCQTISSLVPKQWFTEYMEGITLPQLDNFCRFLFSTANNLKNQASLSSEMRDTIKQIGKVLLRINAESHAMNVGKLIGVKISVD